jgi:hypothetical protein
VRLVELLLLQLSKLVHLSVGGGSKCSDVAADGKGSGDQPPTTKQARRCDGRKHCG